MTRLGFIFYSMIFLASTVMAGKPTAEEENLYNECDKGNGKYSSCTKLIKILSEKCDSGDMIGCSDLGSILGIELGMREAAFVPLEKSCKAGIAESCFALGTQDIGLRGNIKKAIINYTTACEKFTDQKKLFKLRSCALKTALENCLRDEEEHDPVKCALEAFEEITDKYNANSIKE
jgi:putative coA-binding domain protein